MGMELEVKVLNVDVEVEKEKILSKGGKYVADVSQQLYTYDLPSIFGRYREILSQLNTAKSDTSLSVNYEKLKLLFFELDNWDAVSALPFCGVNGINKFSDILALSNWKELVNSSEFKAYMKRFNINPRKWIRLRRTNDKTTLAVKHILADGNSSLQNLMETEITVSSFSETDMLLRQLGYVFKSYQEKRRMIFELREHEIDFDFWPGIPVYMEFEGKSEKDLSEILELLGYSINDVVSCTADAVYEMYGKNMLESRTLTFE